MGPLVAEPMMLFAPSVTVNITVPALTGPCVEVTSAVSVAEPAPYVADAGLAVVVVAYAVTVIVTVAVVDVSGAEHAGRPPAQLSGSPRSVTVNVNESLPEYPAAGVYVRADPD